MTLSAIDVCCGAGGLSLGLQRAGFAVHGVERDDDACETHRAMVGPCDCADVCTWHPPGPVTLVAGGVPCQPFSNAGKRLGVLDVRGSLFEQLVRVAVEAEARVVLLENVRGMVSLGMVPRIEAAYRAAGYEPVHALLDACDYGVPQHRVRLFVVGFRCAEDRAAFRWPAPSHGPPGGCLGLPPWVTVRQALGLEGAFRTGRTERAEAAGWWNGGRYADVDAPAHSVLGKHADDLLARLDAPSPCVTAREQCSALAFGSHGAKTRPRRTGDVLNPALSRLDRPAPTVCGGGTDTGGAEPLGNQRVRQELSAELAAAGLLDRPGTTVDTGTVLSRAGRNGRAGDHARLTGVRLTVAHLAALQGFPEGFRFHGTVTSQHRQVGNAVPAPLAEALGRAILSALDARATVAA